MIIAITRDFKTTGYNGRLDDLILVRSKSRVPEEADKVLLTVEHRERPKIHMPVCVRKEDTLMSMARGLWRQLLFPFMGHSTNEEANAKRDSSCTKLSELFVKEGKEKLIN